MTQTADPDPIARALDAALEAGGGDADSAGTATSSLREHLPAAGARGVLVGIFLRHFG